MLVGRMTINNQYFNDENVSHINDFPNNNNNNNDDNDNNWQKFILNAALMETFY